MNASRIARAAIEAFHATAPKSQLPRPGEEWTVLCAFVARRRARSENSEEGEERPDEAYRVLCWATGTKCTKNDFLRGIEDYALRDAHAEVLAHRALQRYVWEEMIVLQSSSAPAGEDGMNDYFILEQVVSTTLSGPPRFRLKPGVSIHMFISDTPCGIASEFERISKASYRVSGAKSTNSSSASSSSSSSVRLKPGRSDLPPEKRTTSKSCTDKIARWCALGLEGGLLSRVMAGDDNDVVALPLSSLVLGQDAATSAMEIPDPTLIETDEAVRNACCSTVLEALRLGIASRIESLSTSDANSVTFEVAVDVGFPYSRQRVDPPRGGGDGIEKSDGVKRPRREIAGEIDKGEGPPRRAHDAALSWIAHSDKSYRSKKRGIETLTGFYGIRFGASHARRDPAALAGASSDLSRWAMSELIRQRAAWAMDVAMAEPPVQYEQLKTMMSGEAYRARREAFFALPSFAGWHDVAER